MFVDKGARMISYCCERSNGFSTFSMKNLWLSRYKNCWKYLQFDLLFLCYFMLLDKFSSVRVYKSCGFPENLSNYRNICNLPHLLHELSLCLQIWIANLCQYFDFFFFFEVLINWLSRETEIVAWIKIKRKMQRKNIQMSRSHDRM